MRKMGNGYLHGSGRRRLGETGYVRADRLPKELFYFSVLKLFTEESGVERFGEPRPGVSRPRDS
jgi:hypothetical protein